MDWDEIILKKYKFDWVKDYGIYMFFCNFCDIWFIVFFVLYDLLGVIIGNVNYKFWDLCEFVILVNFVIFKIDWVILMI